MIVVDFTTAIAGCLFFILLLVIGKWVAYNLTRERIFSPETKYTQQCPYCTHLFFDFRKDELKICPRCKSYLPQATEKREPRETS